MEEKHELNGLPEAMREPLRRYAETLKELAGDNARSLTLFGAVAAGTFNPGPTRRGASSWWAPWTWRCCGSWQSRVQGLERRASRRP